MNGIAKGIALSLALAASATGTSFALNPQPLPPVARLTLADGRNLNVQGHTALLGSAIAPPGTYTLQDRSIIIVGGKGAILRTTSPQVNRLLAPGSRAMLNPQPLPP